MGCIWLFEPVGKIVGLEPGPGLGRECVIDAWLPTVVLRSGEQKRRRGVDKGGVDLGWNSFFKRCLGFCGEYGLGVGEGSYIGG